MDKPVEQVTLTMKVAIDKCLLEIQNYSYSVYKNMCLFAFIAQNAECQALFCMDRLSKGMALMGLDKLKVHYFKNKCLGLYAVEEKAYLECDENYNNRFECIMNIYCIFAPSAKLSIDGFMELCHAKISDLDAIHGEAIGVNLENKG